MNSQQDVFRVENLSIGFNQTALLENLSFQLEKGKSLALLAPSGFGKTTLLKTLAGLIDPLSGEIYYQNQALKNLDYPGYRSKVMSISQMPTFQNKTALENLKTPFHYHNHKSKWSQKKAETYLKALNLDFKTLSSNINTLSVGQKQRLALIRALLLEPEILLLDEPTSALDQDNKIRVEKLLTDLKKKNSLSFLLATHDKEQAQRICNEVINLCPNP